MPIKTRFPPEPNGYLHIGHCKSLLINYEVENECHLRLDDTNPSTESELFVNEIINDMLWMGYEPGNITYTSDYFTILYDYACLLIKNNCAYVDFTSPETIKEERKNGIESKYRCSSPEDNLIRFNNMKNGKYEETTAVLRLKIDMTNVNYTLRDPIAYRINYSPHFKTGTEWCIYPSYDYSHSIVDAIEHITNSYCTEEFYIRRELYYWTLNALNNFGSNLTPAHVHEFGKLTVENNVLSKRNIKKLIEDKIVTGYDDPSLLTIRGMRNRGFTPEIIKNIAKCSGLGKVKTTISMKYIYHLLNSYYNPIAIRCFAVIKPIKCVIINLYEEKICKHSHMPNKPDYFHTTPINKEIYLEADDFKLEHDEDFYRLSPVNKLVRLKFYDIVKYVNYLDNIIYVEACDLRKDKSVKSTIHWVDLKNSIMAEFIFIDNENPLIKKSYNGFVEKYVSEIDVNSVVEFERIGYFKRLTNGNDDILRFLCIVNLHN